MTTTVAIATGTGTTTTTTTKLNVVLSQSRTLHTLKFICDTESHYKK
jgi:hypothetical protein